MSNMKVLTNVMLFTTTLLWGSGYVFRKIGMTMMTPLMFNGVRFYFAFLFLIALYFINQQRKKQRLEREEPIQDSLPAKIQFRKGLYAGCILAAASGFQQVGMYTTTASKVGFLTSLYIILVPIFGFILFKNKVNAQVWIGAIIALAGIFFISVNESFTIIPGDIIVMISGAFYAFQIIAVGKLIPGSDPILFTAAEMFAGGTLNCIAAFFIESGNTWAGFVGAMGYLIYTGCFAMGLAHALQSTAQKYANPSIVAIILSTESVFGAIFGALILSERMTGQQVLGASLLFAAAIIAQVTFRKPKKESDIAQ